MYVIRLSDQEARRLLEIAEQAAASSRFAARPLRSDAPDSGARREQLAAQTEALRDLLFQQVADQQLDRLREAGFASPTSGLGFEE